MALMVNQEHKSLYKCKTLSGQEKRRETILKQQEKSRDAILDRHRQFIEDFCAEKILEKDQTKKRNFNLSQQLMMSEWMHLPPDDLMRNWMFLLCPAGVRCLVYTQRGRTIAVHKSGNSFLNWQCKLPGGNAKQSHSTVMLDCVYAAESSTFFVLDVLHWSELPLVDTDFAFRQFWIKSKLNETPSVLKHSQGNRYALVPVEARACHPDVLEQVFVSYPHYENNTPRVDGVLFYHKDAFYTSGSTPLVLWAKTFMLPELLGTAVCIEYLDERPEHYIDYKMFITKFDEEYQARKLRVSNRKRGNPMDTTTLTNENELLMESQEIDNKATESDDDESMERRVKKLVEVEMEDGNEFNDSL